MLFSVKWCYYSTMAIISKQTNPDISHRISAWLLQKQKSARYTACKNKGLCHFSFEGGSPTIHILFWCDMNCHFACRFHPSSIYHVVWIMCSVVLTVCQKLLEYLMLFDNFWREIWPTQIQGPKQYIEVNEIVQEKRVMVQLHFTGENIEFVGWFKGSPRLC